MSTAGAIARRLQQQTVLATFGELALRSDDLDVVLTEACRLVGDGLGTDLAKVMELQADGHTLLVRAGVGWLPGVVGATTLDAGIDSSEGHALRTGLPMVSNNIATERRFSYAEFLTDNGVQAVANVLIIGAEGQPAYGILQIDSRTVRRWRPGDVAFLQGYANLLAAAVARLRALAELRAAHDRQAFLAREVDHRAKNALAVVQAAVRLTKAATVEAFVAAVQGRIAALARAHTLLSADRWAGADLHTLLQGELAPFLAHPPSATLHGPVVALPPPLAQPVAVVIHELATNAAKYGALSVATGRLVLSWHVTEETLHLRWLETGGPPVAGPPVRRGFGGRVIEGSLRGLGGSVTQSWAIEGMGADIALPLVPALQPLVD